MTKNIVCTFDLFKNSKDECDLTKNLNVGKILEYLEKKEEKLLTEINDNQCSLSTLRMHLICREIRVEEGKMINKTLFDLQRDIVSLNRYVEYTKTNYVRRPECLAGKYYDSEFLEAGYLPDVDSNGKGTPPKYTPPEYKSKIMIELQDKFKVSMPKVVVLGVLNHEKPEEFPYYSLNDLISAYSQFYANIKSATEFKKTSFEYINLVHEIRGSTFFMQHVASPFWSKKELDRILSITQGIETMEAMDDKIKILADEVIDKISRHNATTQLGNLLMVSALNRSNMHRFACMESSISDS